MPTLKSYSNKDGVYIVANVGGAHPVTLQVPTVTERILRKAGYDPEGTVPTTVVWSLYDLGLLYTAGSITEIPEDVDITLEIFDDLNISSELTEQERDQLLKALQDYEGPKASKVAEFRQTLKETTPQSQQSQKSESSGDVGNAVSKLYSASTRSWTLFRGNLRRTGATDESAPTDTVEEAWSTTLKYGDIIPSPVVAGDLIFAISGINIYAVNRRTGDILWEQKTSRINPNLAHPESTPALYEQIMFFGAHGGIAAIDTQTGNPYWTYDETQVWLSSPLVADETLFIGTADEQVVALDAVTGETVWHFETNAPVTASPAYDDGTLYAAAVDGTVYALDADTGTEHWSAVRADAYIPNSSHSTPAVGGECLYVGHSSREVYAYAQDSGRELWRTELDRIVQSSPALTEKIAVVMTDEDDVVALNRTDGTIRWSVETESRESPSSLTSSPVIADGTVVVGGHAAPIRAIDSESGEVLWEFDTGTSVCSTPTVVDGEVYVSTDGKLLALATST